jgi:hypothetical protein
MWWFDEILNELAYELKSWLDLLNEPSRVELGFQLNILTSWAITSRAGWISTHAWICRELPLLQYSLSLSPGWATQTPATQEEGSPVPMESAVRQGAFCKKCWDY